MVSFLSDIEECAELQLQVRVLQPDIILTSAGYNLTTTNVL